MAAQPRGRHRHNRGRRGDEPRVGPGAVDREDVVPGLIRGEQNTVYLPIALVLWTLVAGLVVVRPTVSEERDEVRDQVKATTPDAHTANRTIPMSQTTGSAAGRYVQLFVALLSAFLALLFTAAAVLALVLDGCEMEGVFSGSGIESCEPRSVPSRIPIALPPLVLAAMLWAGSIALIRPRRPQDGEPGWRPDPTGRFEKRYYGPKGWTDHVANIDEKLQTRDPILGRGSPSHRQTDR